MATSEDINLAIDNGTYASVKQMQGSLPTVGW